MKIQDFQQTIEFVGSGLEPDGDWIPALFLSKDGVGAIIGVAHMGNQTEKQMAAWMLNEVISKTNPDHAIFVTTAWVGDSIEGRFSSREEFCEAVDKGWVPRPSMDPDRREIVNAVMVSKNKTQSMMVGYIERSKDKPPRIVKWEVHEGPDVQVGGLFGYAMLKGFAEADKEGNLEMLSKIAGLRQQEDKGKT